MELIRLCWGGGLLGFEQMKLKQGKLVGAFIANQKHPYFGSWTSTAIPRSVQQQPGRFKVYEKNSTLRLSLGDMKNIKQAKEALESVLVAVAPR